MAATSFAAHASRSAMRTHATRSAASAAWASSTFCRSATRRINSGRSPSSIVAPNAVSAAERTRASGSSAAFNKRGRRALDPPPSDKLDEDLPVLAFRLGQPGGQLVVHLLAGQIRQHRQGRFRHVRVGLLRQFPEHRHARHAAQPRQHADRHQPRLRRTALGRFEHRGQGRRIAPVGQGKDQQALPIRRRSPQFGHQGVGRLPARNLAGGRESHRQERFVRRPQLLDQQRQSRRLACQDRAAGGFENPLLGHVRLADQVVQPHRFGRFPVGQEPFRAEDTALGNGRADRGWDVGQRLLQGPAAAAPPMRPRATAAADATSASGSFSCSISASTALASRRTPIELIAPTSSRPCNLPIASRRASPAAGSGIASKAIRAQEDSSLSGSSAANAGTASLPP